MLFNLNDSNGQNTKLSFLFVLKIGFFNRAPQVEHIIEC